MRRTRWDSRIMAAFGEVPIMHTPRASSCCRVRQTSGITTKDKT
jgi:hypothetical protein